MKNLNEKNNNKLVSWPPMAIDNIDDFTADNISASIGIGPSSFGQLQPYPRRGNETSSVLR
jgi:hypothetical protein